jgi:hypothetical protein
VALLREGQGFEAMVGRSSRIGAAKMLEDSPKHLRAAGIFGGVRLTLRSEQAGAVSSLD